MTSAQFEREVKKILASESGDTLHDLNALLNRAAKALRTQENAGLRHLVSVVREMIKKGMI
jgi:hypothetical protein